MDKYERDNEDDYSLKIQTKSLLNWNQQLIGKWWQYKNIIDMKYRHNYVDDERQKV